MPAGEHLRLVPVGQISLLADALIRAGAEAELVIIPGADHVFDGVDPRPCVDGAVEFLRARLK